MLHEEMIIPVRDIKYKREFNIILRNVSPLYFVQFPQNKKYGK